GFFLGLMLQILFTLMSLLGQILSLQMGLAMGIMNDPANGQAVPLMGQMLIILGSFLFFVFDGHLVALAVLVESFFTWPPGSSRVAPDLGRILDLFGCRFGGALTLAMPAVIAMPTINLAHGVMNRSPPTLSIVARGFPLTTFMGRASPIRTVSGTP